MSEATFAIRFSFAELEMIEHSVAKRLQTWAWTEEYLRTGKADGLTAECSKIEEARWVLDEYRKLHRRLARILERGAS